MSAIYDRLGVGYAGHRRPDPRVAAFIDEALGDARTVVNVGAGTGSYEPRDRRVVAVEPSAVMIGQRAPHAAPAVQAVGESLPFAAGAFDASLASLTIHHWPDRAGGLSEMRRVSRGPVVLFVFELAAQEHFWLVEDYLPEALTLAEGSIAEIEGVLGPVRSTVVPVPADCTDGFLCAYWARPEAYLDPAVRAAISTFHLLPDAVCERAVHALGNDLASGAWETRHGALRRLESMDLGYRVVVATS